MENLPPEGNNFVGKAKFYWQKISGQENFFNELGIGLIVCLIAIGVLVIILIKPTEIGRLTRNLALNPNKVVSTPTLIPTPTSIPLPKGPRLFGISTNNNPQMTALNFSEYDPEVGQSQTITISVVDKKSNVKSVEIALTTDNKTKTYQLKLSSGTTKKGDWSVTIQAEDTHKYVYKMKVTAKNEQGQISTVEPMFR